jgi:N-carbamoylputrescine amidase
MSKVKVGLVQMSCTNNKEQNLQKAIDKTKEAASKGAQIICLQELFTSLYFCDVEDYENFKLAESIPGSSTDAFCKIAKELNVVIIASLFEKRAQGIYHNTTAVISRQVILDIKCSTQNSQNLACSFAGINGILKLRVLPH